MSNQPAGHPTFEQLTAFAEGQLEAAPARDLQTHLAAGCPACQADLDWLQQTLTLLAEEEWHSPPAHLSTAARQAFQQRPQPQTRPWFSPLLDWWQSLSLPRPQLAWATLLLVFLVAGLLTSNRGQTAEAVASVDWFGYAEMQPANAAGWQPASGVALRAGDWMRTDEGATALLSFFGQNVTRLAGDTEIAIAALQTGQSPEPPLAVILLQRGELEGNIGQDDASDVQLVVATSAAVISGQQAHFFVLLQPDGTTLVTVEQGSVQVVAQSVTVTARTGQSISIRVGKPPVILGSTATAARISPAVPPLNLAS